MWVVCRLLAVLGLVVAVVGFVGFISAIVSVWKLKTEVNQRTDVLAGRAHVAINAADHAVEFVREVITQSQTDLTETRRRQSAAPQQPVNPFLQLSARRASENLVGSVERANAAVITASDAAVVAEAALNVFGEEGQMSDLKAWLGVKPEQLAQTRTDLGTATRELKSVRTVLGVPVDCQLTAEQLVTVESALNQAAGFTEQMGKVVATARTQVDETKRTVDLWVLRVALGVTLVGVLGAAGQFFMARFCWRVLRGKPA
jgi:hypothetical protein